MTPSRKVGDRLKIIATDRYSVLRHGSCNGPCEGTGWVPVKKDDRNPVLRKLWKQAHQRSRHKCDGWHFVKCPRCKGTGNANRT
jgi:hypothetical protein